MSKNNHSHHNYAKYSNNNHKKPAEVTPVAEEVAPVVQEPVVETTPTPAPVVQEPVVEQMRFIPVEGTVVDCVKLNVRVRPISGANVTGTIDAGTKVEIITEKSTADWFYVCIATGLEGYCMRKYIKSDL